MSESLDPAMMAVMTSGAPLAKAKNVTPAKVGEISTYLYVLLNLTMNSSTHGERYSWAMTFNVLKMSTNKGICVRFLIPQETIGS